MSPLRGPTLNLALLALLSLSFAGCISDHVDDIDDASSDLDARLGLLSEKVYEEVEKFQVQVPGHDGKLQDTWVYRPKTDDPDARFPVFINFSPYWDNAAPPADTTGDAFSQYMIDEYVPRGYAVVLASVRGTGHSEGCFAIGGAAELEDAYAVIDHYANVAWSNGNVSSGGKSYDGTTIQGVVGYKPHPALKLIFPVSGISELYKYNYRNGVPYFHGTIFNAYYYMGQGMDASPFDPLDGSFDGNVKPALLPDDVACADFPQVQANGVASAATGLYTPYWQERDYTRYADQIPEEMGIFYVHGLQDWNVKPDHILPWLDAIPDGVFVKGWLHQDLYNNGHVYPMRDDWNQTMLRMMDHFLKGIDTGITEEPAFQVEDTTGQWRHEDQWPPAHANVARFALEDGVFDSAPTGGNRFEWTYEVGEDGLHYAGIPVLDVELTLWGEEAFWVAQLWLENETGRHWMNEGVLRATLRHGLETPEPVLPGQPQGYLIEFYPQDDVFPANSTMVLTVAQSGSKYALTDDELSPQWSIDASTAELLLPVVDAANVVYEDPQPVATPCWAC